MNKYGIWISVAGSTLILGTLASMISLKPLIFLAVGLGLIIRGISMIIKYETDKQSNI